MIIDLAKALDQFAGSRSEARRMIAQGRVKVNGQVITDLEVETDQEVTIAVVGRQNGRGIIHIPKGE